MNKMNIQILAIHQDVIKKDQNKSSEERLLNLIHEGLECGRSIGETERHHQELIMPLMSSESCLLYIIFLHPNLMIA